MSIQWYCVLGMCSWVTCFGLSFGVLYDVKWLGPKRICSECFSCQAVEVSKGITVYQRHVLAVRMRSTHFWNIGCYLNAFDWIKKVLTAFDWPKKGLIP